MKSVLRLRPGRAASRLAAAIMALATASALRPQPPAPAAVPRYQAGVSPEVPARLDLPNALAFALQNNFAIRQARERIEEQEGLIVEVRAAALPTVGVSGSYYRLDEGLSESGPNAFAPAADQRWAIALEARQTLYAGGGVRAALDVQQLVREAALLDLQSVINDQLLAVRTKFYEVLLARESIAVQEQNVQLLQEQLTTSRNRFEAGAVSNFDVLRAEVELANAQPALITARNRFRTSIEELRQLLGYNAPDTADSRRRVPEFLGELTYEPVNYELETALTAAHENRPELQRLAKIEDARERGIDIERAGFKPSLALVAGYQVNKSSFSDNFDDSLDGWVVGLEGRWDIWNGGATRGRVRQARSQYHQARLQTAEAELGIEVEVRRALSSLQEATELAQAAGKVVAQAEEAQRLAQARYGAGTATQLDVLQSQVALTEARTNQLQANYNFAVALATLRKAMGQAESYTVTE